MGEMTSAHFIYIPATLLLGIVIGWIMASRAAADASAMLAKRERERAARAASRPPEPPGQSLTGSD